MDIKCKLTIYFEDPFWVGVFEVENLKRLRVCKITFGAEPKDGEIYDFILKKWSSLNFSPETKSIGFSNKKVNPKRMQRSINKQVLEKGIGTKAQEALKIQYESNSIERKKTRKMKKEEAKERKFCIKQMKKKQKHKGR